MSVTLDDRVLKAIINNTPDHLERWLDGVIEEMVSDAKLLFGTGPDGIAYGNHIASSPGYPPNSDTGTLVNSLHWEPDGPLRRLFLDGVEHGIYMEEGTTTIEPRPFATPVFEDWRKKIGQDAIDQGIVKP